MRRSWLAAFAVLGVAASAGAQGEPTKEQCVAANEAAQILRQAGKLAAASEQLRVCIAASCPVVVRDDCSQRLDEIQRVQPSLVFEAKDATGRDVSAVKVTVDGRALVDHLDGTAIVVDPGEHTFTFETAGQPAITHRFVVREGERAHHQLVVVPSAGSAAPAEATTDAGPIRSPLRMVGIVVAGAGLVGLVTAAIAGGVAASRWQRAKSECDPNNLVSCPNHAAAVADQAGASSAATIADVGFIAGALLVAGGAALFFLAPSGHERARAGWKLTPSVDVSGGGVTLHGSF